MSLWNGVRPDILYVAGRVIFDHPDTKQTMIVKSAARKLAGLPGDDIPDQPHLVKLTHRQTELRIDYPRVTEDSFTDNAISRLVTAWGQREVTPRFGQRVGDWVSSIGAGLGTPRTTTVQAAAARPRRHCRASQPQTKVEGK